MKSKAAIYLENVCESGCACLLTMVQGNVLTLTLSHWLTASQTGLLAGAVATTAVVTAKLRRPWLVSATLGAATAGADFVVHPATFGLGGGVEAVVTGFGATALSLAVGKLVRSYRSASTAAAGGRRSDGDSGSDSRRSNACQRASVSSPASRST